MMLDECLETMRSIVQGGTKESMFPYNDGPALPSFAEDYPVDC